MLNQHHERKAIEPQLPSYTDREPEKIEEDFERTKKVKFKLDKPILAMKMGLELTVTVYKE
ncbi:hypothetical protein [Shewanella sp. NIFS-20-20]|uniref:hypothetical protein n=1 Tax=Shewanella sp. NIFS-20-20 TaxID=2853806 RepID=UPI001C483A97|nr:hypothetical protein [Shewanella sp. NIFS-20-20]MBV7315373.1 hypothetical protein [Shewanella sp. NIFS-20-20]